MSIKSAEPVLLVGAGPATREDFDLAKRHASRVVAVDGGYDHLVSWNVRPDAVLGDMDSIRAALPDETTAIPMAEQDSTDLEKALRSISAPLIIGIGFLGGRSDHTLAAMHALVATETNAILFGEEDVVFAAPTEWRAEMSVGTRVSFYPVRRTPAVGSKGLRWPLDDLVMEGGAQIGVSNEVVSPSVAAWFTERGVVTILPRVALAAVIDSLT